MRYMNYMNYDSFAFQNSFTVRFNKICTYKDFALDGKEELSFEVFHHHEMKSFNTYKT